MSIRRGITKFRIYRKSENVTRMENIQFNKDECGPMVLDGLIHIKNNIDRTLGFRRSCREGICARCAMNINGINNIE